MCRRVELLVHGIRQAEWSRRIGRCFRRPHAELHSTPTCNATMLLLVILTTVLLLIVSNRLLLIVFTALLLLLLVLILLLVVQHTSWRCRCAVARTCG